jgi:hypothetical protein
LGRGQSGRLQTGYSWLTKVKPRAKCLRFGPRRGDTSGVLAKCRHSRQEAAARLPSSGFCSRTVDRPSRESKRACENKSENIRLVLKGHQLTHGSLRVRGHYANLQVSGHVRSRTLTDTTCTYDTLLGVKRSWVRVPPARQKTWSEVLLNGKRACDSGAVSPNVLLESGGAASGRVCPPCCRSITCRRRNRWWRNRPCPSTTRQTREAVALTRAGRSFGPVIGVAI